MFDGLKLGTELKMTQKHKIKVYSTPTCPYCHQVKVLLKENNVSQDSDKAKGMVNKSGQGEVPVIDIDGKIVVGFDKERLMEILK